MKDIPSLWMVGLSVLLTAIASAQARTGEIAPGPERACGNEES
jgi:hypothetical protein